MKILIIGCKGFIGNYIFNYFKNIGFDVKGCDVVTDYNLNSYYQIDATNSDYHFIFQNNKFDFCINCSGAASVPLSFENPLKDFTLNTLNVYKILDSIRLYNDNCKFLNISSAAVYGNPKKLPISENHPLEPLSPYGLNKLQAEQICNLFFSLYGIKTSSIRVFSAYGPGLKKQLLWDLWRKFNENEKIELFGTGFESRDFIYIEDIARAIYLILMEYDFDGKTINVASGKEYTINYITTLFSNKINFKKEIFFNKIQKKGDPLNWKADISLLNKLGFNIKYDIEEGVNLYIKWAKELQ